MKKLFIFIILVSLCVACTVAPVATPTPTETLIPPIATVTPSPVWFPPTATHTVFPTLIITPTVDMRPKLGEILIKDDFSDSKLWQLSQSDSGSVAVAINMLTIAIGETNATLTSIRSDPVFADFYLEITAETSLCRDFDEYGILFRATSASNFYRFSLSCNGQARVDRVIAGQASSPQPWIMSGAVPPGAPSSSRIGIGAIGSQMDFFVNGQYQFTVKDPLLTSGGIGVFARSVNKMAVTVNFSDLVVYKVEK
jgi:hypothetical protein